MKILCGMQVGSWLSQKPKNDIREPGSISKMSEKTEKQEFLKDVSYGRLSEKPNKKWRLRTDSNRHEDKPQGIFSPVTPVTHIQVP